MKIQEIVNDISSICQIIPKELDGYRFTIAWMGFGWQIGYDNGKSWLGLPLYQSGIRGKSETLEEALCEFIKILNEYDNK